MTEPKVELLQKEEHTVEVSITSRILLKNVWIDIDPEIGLTNDNYCDVDPGIAKTIRISTKIPVEEIREQLKIRFA